jgi:hypothetical protein
MLPDLPVFIRHLTLAQLLSVMGWVGAQAVAFGWLDGTKEQIILSAGATILAAAWHAADAWIHSANMKAKTAYSLHMMPPNSTSTTGAPKR